MPKKQGQPNDDPSSAPESGTVRDETSGKDSPERADNQEQKQRGGKGGDASNANEEP